MTRRRARLNRRHDPRRKNVTRSAAAALYEMSYYNKMNLFILDKLSQRISETSTAGSWRQVHALPPPPRTPRDMISSYMKFSRKVFT